MTDEMLMAYADGQLDGEAAAEIAAAIGADPALAARVAAFVQSREAVAAAFGALPAAPEPDPIAARIRALAAEASASNVVPLKRRVVPIWQLPIAASIALAAGLTASLLMQSSDGAVALIPDDPALFSALSTLPSGDRLTLDGGAELALIATFENGDRSLCREFEYDRPDGLTTVAVACRTEAAWDVQLAIAADAGAEGYAPASSLEALDAWLVATGAGAPLALEDEAAALQVNGL